MNPAQSKKTLLFGNQDKTNNNQSLNSNSNNNQTSSQQSDPLQQAAQLASSLNQNNSSTNDNNTLNNNFQKKQEAQPLNSNSNNLTSNPSENKTPQNNNLNQNNSLNNLSGLNSNSPLENKQKDLNSLNHQNNFSQNQKQTSNDLKIPKPPTPKNDQTTNNLTIPKPPTPNNNQNNGLKIDLEKKNDSILNSSPANNQTNKPNENFKQNKSNLNTEISNFNSQKSAIGNQDNLKDQKKSNEIGNLNSLNINGSGDLDINNQKKDDLNLNNNPNSKLNNISELNDNSQKKESLDKTDKQLPFNKNIEINTKELPNVTITNLKAREILDSRGVPTVEVTIKLSNGLSSISSISTTTHGNDFEATQIRDRDSNRMLGLGVLKAVENVNKIIAPNIVGLNPFDQEKIDLRLLELDGTKNASHLGSNATMTVSQATLKAGALVLNLPTYYYIFKKYNLCKNMSIPTCLYGLIDGGKHGSKNNIDFQEFQIVPANHITFDKSLEMAVSVFNNLKKILIEKGAACSVGPSGGYTPNLFKNTDAFELLIEAIKDSNYNVGRDVFFGIDADGTFLEEKGKYKVRDFNNPIDTKAMIEYYKKLNSVYGLYVIEDPFAKTDEKSWIEINKEMGEVARIVGDNNLAANKIKLEKAIKKNSGNTVLVKTGQLSTITEMFEIVQIAKNNNWQVIISNREGETNDDLIADIAVGVGAHYLKFGPPNRGERIAKYNRLLKINQELEKLNHV